MSYQKVALITGVTGQDGALLAELLLSKNYMVHGVKRRASLINTERVDHLYQDPHEPNVRFLMHYGDMTDATNLIRIIQEVQPDEIYNLAAQSHVQVSFETPEYTANSDGLGTLRVLEAIRILSLTQKTRFYQASTSELYGKAQAVPQNETHALLSEVALRRSQALRLLDHGQLSRSLRHACLERHPLQSRGSDPSRDFVTRKITRAVAAIHLGNRSGSFLAISTPSATGATRAITSMACGGSSSRMNPTTTCSRPARRTVCASLSNLPLREVGTTIEWRGSGREEQGFDAKTGRALVAVDPGYFRPTEVDLLLGDPSKARQRLGWHHKTTFAELVAEMVASDLARLRRTKWT